jgi:hypothetical protein
MGNTKHSCEREHELFVLIAYPVAVVGDELQEVEGLVAAVHLQIQLPGTARIATDNIVIVIEKIR